MMKKLLILLVGLFGIINFSSAGSYTYTGSYTVYFNSSSQTSNGVKEFFLPVPFVESLNTSLSSQVNNIVCSISNFNNDGGLTIGELNLQLRYTTNGNSSGLPFSLGSSNPSTFGNGVYTFNLSSSISGVPFYLDFLITFSRPNNANNISFDYSCIISGNNIINQSDIGGGSCDCPSCPVMSSSECQTEYNLIPISSVDSSYCVNNNLCPISEGTGDIQWSALYINDIQHLGAGLINITIPEEIEWNYTNENDELDLDIVGYNVDTEYIEGIINTQNTQPNKTDFNNIITVLIPLFVPGFIIILFIIFVFKLIKKLF